MKASKTCISVKLYRFPIILGGYKVSCSCILTALW